VKPAESTAARLLRNRRDGTADYLRYSGEQAGVPNARRFHASDVYRRVPANAATRRTVHTADQPSMHYVHELLGARSSSLKIGTVCPSEIREELLLEA